ncbi:MAG: DNA-3-methyladenine glycosylase I [Acetatifactor sp.]|nr:DNA-3-methyladenine glycosylase I [Acetatifactor sp.]
MERCGWCLLNELEIKYHDEEWGVPVYDDRKQFEYLMLEAMQCGLSWDIVLKKREIFRSCFHNFDYDVIAAYSEDDIDRIMNMEGMIRSRKKIEAVINNARRFQEIRREFGSFSDYLWGYTDGKMVLYSGHETGKVPAANGLSDRIAADLKKRGFKYLGSVTVYAHLQASGVVNDHWSGCHCYEKLVSQHPTIKKRRDKER